MDSIVLIFLIVLSPVCLCVGRAFGCQHEMSIVLYHRDRQIQDRECGGRDAVLFNLVFCPVVYGFLWLSLHQQLVVMVAPRWCFRWSPPTVERASLYSSWPSKQDYPDKTTRKKGGRRSLGFTRSLARCVSVWPARLYRQKWG